MGASLPTPRYGRWPSAPSLGWLTLAEMMARRAATSARTTPVPGSPRETTKFISEVIWFVL